MSPLNNLNAGHAPSPAEQPISHDLVERLTRSILDEPMTRHLAGARIPDREAVAQFVDEVRELCFPGFFGRRGMTEQNMRLYVEDLLARITLLAAEQVLAVMRYMRSADDEDCLDDPGVDEECSRKAREVAHAFVEFLPDLRAALALDVQAAYDGDPAAEHSDVTIFCYPGVEAIFSHRVAHAFYKMGVPLLPRIIQELAHSRTGIDVHPGATIGKSFFIDHGGAVVIGETARIGDNVRIYQGVTLGAKSFEKDETGRMRKGGPQRHPTLGNRVIVYANAVILGGDTIIGDDCIVSGGTFVATSVPTGHLVHTRNAELVVRENREARRHFVGDGDGI